MTQDGASKSTPEGAQLSDDIAVLEAQIAEFSLEMERTKQQIRDLMAAEDPATGLSHHKAIFQGQQNKLRLEVEIQFRQNKINRIRLGVDGKEGRNTPPDGFLF